MTDSDIKLDFFRTKCATKFLCVKTFSGKVAKYSLAYLSAHEWLLDDAPLHANFVRQVNHPCCGSGASAAHQRLEEICRIHYVYCNDYNAI